MFERFRLFRKFRVKKWKKYSPEKRLQCAQAFEEFFAKKHGRDYLIVEPANEEMKDALGLCKYSERRLLIHSDLLFDASKMFMLMSTLLHEGRHGYQVKYIEVAYRDGNKVSKFSKAYQWKIAFGGYLSGVDGENDYADYANQSVELDANMYAYKQLKKVKRKYSKFKEYHQEVKRLEEWFELVAKLGKEKYGLFYKFKVKRKNKKEFKKNQQKG